MEKFVIGRMLGLPHLHLVSHNSLTGKWSRNDEGLEPQQAAFDLLPRAGNVSAIVTHEYQHSETHVTLRELSGLLSENISKDQAMPADDDQLEPGHQVHCIFPDNT